MSASVYDTSVDTELLTGMRLARQAVGRGELIVLPTDTVYGVGADAFNPQAVQRLLDAKGRGRTSPPPVLIGTAATLDALAAEVPQVVRDLVAEFWPGGLTVIVKAQPSLAWDLGETRGTVALRMPNSTVALELLRETGPLAVSSANLTGEPSALTADQAREMLGDSVAVYLEAGPAGADYGTEGTATAASGSTIVDATAVDGPGSLTIVRQGVVARAEIARVAGDLLADEAGAGTT